MEANNDTPVDDYKAAGKLGVAVQTMRNWRFEGRGPAYLKLGRSVRYQLADIEAYKRKKRVDPEK